MFARICSWIGLICGLLSAIGGVFMSVPAVWSVPWLSQPNVAISEFPEMPIGLGLAAILLSRHGRRFGGWLGLIGIVLAVRPLFRLRTTIDRNTAAMRDGLGATFEAELPPVALIHSTRAPLDFVGQMRERQNTEAHIHVTHDVLFHVADGNELRVDVYEPIGGDGPHPAMLSLHGGSWRSGDKGGFYVGHNRWLARQGYVVVDVQYRLSPLAIWPEHLRDVKAAIRWTRTNADRFGIDPERIAIMGRSAGAHLALMAAFTPCDPAFPPEAGMTERDDVAAVVAMYAPTDLPLLQETVHGSLSYWLGERIADRPDVYRDASPLFRVGANAPPVLLAHGGRDNLVVPEHSERLHRRLRELGRTSVLLHYPWGRHGFDFSLNGLGGQMLQYDMDRFLAWTLRDRSKGANHDT